MINDKQILSCLPKALKSVDLPGAGKKIQGKVRDIYIKNDRRIIITTDRQSAFDYVLGFVPYKGAVLNLLSAFWFDKIRQLIPNHLVAVPDANVSIVKNCQPIPVEMVVRGYMTGVTNTSIWYSYSKGERIIYGIKFPEGLRKNQILPHPVITPTTHAEIGQHDERLTRKQIIKSGLVEAKLYRQMEKATLALFAFGSKLAQKRGLILVDTKYEFGLYDGKLTLMDELHTPDSSRFWVAKTYSRLFKAGKEPESLSKEFLRLWYKKHGYGGEGKPAQMPAHLAVRLAHLYIRTYETLTGKKFKPFDYPIEERIKKNIAKYLKEN